MNSEQNFGQFYKLMQSEIANRQNEIDSLKALVSLHKQFSDESIRISPEVKVLFPSIKDIALSHMVATQVGGNATDTVSMLFVNAPAGLTIKEREKLTEYIEVRLKRKNIHLTMNPSNFPWPSSSSK